MSGPLHEGTVFAGRYHIIRCIAAGGMGAVYEAVHLGTQRHRALKVMLPHLFANDEMRERFIREARVTSLIESEFIVDVADAGVDETTRIPFLVMELLQGEELEKRLHRIGKIAPGDVVTYLTQVAGALDRAHKASVIHRDLKPANLFLTQRDDGSPRVKILDFGIAKVIKETATAAKGTRALGTPLYMPPEQFRAGSQLSPAADIYALGMVAYTLLVGEAYWTIEASQSWDAIALGMVILRGPEVSAIQRAAAKGVTLPPTFDDWFRKVTATNPAERFSSASAAITALAHVLQGGLGTATATSGEVPAAEPAIRIPEPPSNAIVTPTPTPVPKLEAPMSTTSAMITSPPLPQHRMPPFTIIALVTVTLGIVATAVMAFIGPNDPTQNKPAQTLPMTSTTSSVAIAPALSAAPVVTTGEPLPTTTAQPSNPPELPSTKTPTPNAQPRKTIKGAGGPTPSKPNGVDPALLGRP